MAFDMAADLDAIFTDLQKLGGAQWVTCGSAKAPGTVDAVDLTVLDDNGMAVAVRKTLVTVRTGALPALKEGASVVVQGKTWVAQSVARKGDTNETEFYLAKP